ncbi:hypothetical protein [Hymenobacter rigui]|uniref:STAS/SEC14 domain-containing protein n=1 Tax=Hymenobacter rigui TaxID=334424 RepID=A0A3R9PT00_9BACT|nr:hypothetical protein [Hymenobacter rigui]RSK45215.1 hypothetical protein EI291_19070 [Hymenobacter rigui]
MHHEFNNTFGEVYLFTVFDQPNNWIYNDWQGLLSPGSVLEGCMGVLDILQRTQCAYMLNDNRRVLGSWQQANEWIEQEWIPKALAAGLRYHAHVVAPGVFGQAAAEDMHLRVGNSFHMRLFEQLDDAQTWLREKQLADHQTALGE